MSQTAVFVGLERIGRELIKPYMIYWIFQKIEAGHLSIDGKSILI